MHHRIKHKQYKQCTVRVLSNAGHLVRGARAGGQCLLGNSVTESREYTIAGGYLDIDHPATCAGLLTGWNLCYHTGALQTAYPYNAYLRVWKPIGDSNYTLVHDHHVALTFNSTRDEVVCISEEVEDVGEQLQVMPGYITGVYTPHRNFRGQDLDTPLSVYGVTNGGRLIYDGRRKIAAYRGDDIEITDSRVVEVADVVLHAYANIGKSRLIKYINGDVF